MEARSGPYPSGILALLQRCTVNAKTHIVYSSEPRGVDGWLWLFILGQVFGAPLLALLTLRGSSLLGSALALALAAFSVYTGIVLWRVRPYALRLLGTWFAVLVFVWLAMLAMLGLAAHPGNPNTAVEAEIRGPVTLVIWFLYFKYSKRVKNTYGRNL